MQVFDFSAILYHRSIAVAVGGDSLNYYYNIWVFGFIEKGRGIFNSCLLIALNELLLTISLVPLFSPEKELRNL